MSLTDIEYAALESALNGLTIEDAGAETSELLWHLERKDLCDKTYDRDSNAVYRTNAHGRAVLRQYAEELEQKDRDKAAQEAAEKRNRKYQLAMMFLGSFFGALFGLLIQILYTWISHL